MAYWTESNTPLLKSSDPDDGNIWVGPARRTERHDTVCGTVFADQAGTVYIEQSADGGENWDVSTSHAVSASTALSYSEALILPVWRLRYVNTTDTDQTKFRINGHTIASGDS